MAPDLSSAHGALAPLGADSLTWALMGSRRFRLGGPRAILLQAAHPTVAAAVADHSGFRSDPWGRLFRTMGVMGKIVFGGPLSLEAAQRLRRGHAQMSGTAADGTTYSAIDPAAFAWVHATLFETTYRVGAAFIRPLSASDGRQLYAEFAQLGRLYGVDPTELPEDLSDFWGYYDNMVGTVLRTNPVTDQIRAMVADPAPPPGWRGGALWPLTSFGATKVLNLATAGTLTPSAREVLGLTWTKVDAVAYAAATRGTRTLGYLTPRPWRFGPAARQAYQETRRAGTRAR
jgi:uncharacterized protein (DUF2236 family)